MSFEGYKDTDAIETKVVEEAPVKENKTTKKTKAPKVDPVDASLEARIIKEAKAGQYGIGEAFDTAITAMGFNPETIREKMK